MGALLADLDVVRLGLLYGLDKHGLAPCAPVCLRPPHYIALRMALDLAEQSRGVAP